MLLYDSSIASWSTNQVLENFTFLMEANTRDLNARKIDLIHG